MKQLKLFLALLIIGAMAVSCKKEKVENTDAKLVTKIIETDENGLSTTRHYEYNGTKITKVKQTSDEGTTIFTYKYTGDNITKITESNERGIYKTMSFMYAGDKLISWAENYETDSEFNFHKENVVIRKDTTYGSMNVEALQHYNAGVLQSTRLVIIPPSLFQHIGRATGKAIENTNISSSYQTYDSAKNLEIHFFFTRNSNPHQNITGWTKLELVNPALYGKTCIAHYQNSSENANYNFYYDNNRTDRHSTNMPTSMKKEKNDANLTGAGGAQYFY